MKTNSEAHGECCRSITARFKLPKGETPLVIMRISPLFIDNIYLSLYILLVY